MYIHSGAAVGNKRRLANAVHHAGVLSLSDDCLDMIDWGQIK